MVTLIFNARLEAQSSLFQPLGTGTQMEDCAGQVSRGQAWRGHRSVFTFYGPQLGHMAVGTREAGNTQQEKKSRFEQTATDRVSAGLAFCTFYILKHITVLFKIMKTT